MNYAFNPALHAFYSMTINRENADWSPLNREIGAQVFGQGMQGTPRPQPISRPITKSFQYPNSFDSLWSDYSNGWSGGSSLRSMSPTSEGTLSTPVSTPASTCHAHTALPFQFLQPVADEPVFTFGATKEMNPQAKHSCAHRRLHVSNIPFRYTANHLKEIFNVSPTAKALQMT